MTDELILKHYNLQDVPNLKPIGYVTEEEWHLLRQKGIGGSDVGAILGMNDYNTPLQVYKSKVEGVKPSSDSVYTRKGKDLEELIRNYYVIPELNKKGYKVLPVRHLLINENYPWLRANLDGIAIKEDGSYRDNIVIEIKWVSEWGAQKWDTEDSLTGIPPSYYAQVQTYMLVTGARKAIVCALFDSTWEMKYYSIPRDEAFIAKLISKTKIFWDLNICMKIPPKYSSKLDREFITEELDPKKEILLDDSMNVDVSEYKRIKKSLKDLEKELETIEDIIVNKYMEGRRPSSPLCKVSINTYPTKRFDTIRFKEDHPEIYNNYTKEGTVSRINIK